MREVRRMRWVAALAAAVVGAGIVGVVPAGSAVAQGGASGPPVVRELATFVDGPCTDDICSQGSTVGPDGALYVAEETGGRIQRIDPGSGTVTTYADGFPRAIAGVIGDGIVDIAFRGSTAYVLIAGVNKFIVDLVGSTQTPVTDGIYRLDSVGVGHTRWALVADLYSWSEVHPPTGIDFFIPGGYPYAFEAYRDGFLVNDAHHNRTLKVSAHGAISQFHAFGNVVPTGLETGGGPVLVGQAGPVPHRPETGRVLTLSRSGRDAKLLATGAPLLVDVERSRNGTVYGLSQGYWYYADPNGKEGYPALPYTGLLMRADGRGHFRPVAFHLDRPTTFEIIGDTAYVVTITGTVMTVSGLSRAC